VNGSKTDFFGLEEYGVKRITYHPYPLKISLFTGSQPKNKLYLTNPWGYI